MLRRLTAFWAYAGEIARLGAGPAGRARIRLAAIWLLARIYVPRLPARRVRVTIRRRGQVLPVVLGQYPDLETMRELYIDEEYGARLVEDARVILDVGANIGLSVLDFRLRYPNARIHAFEPDPAAYGTLVQNTRRDPLITAWHVAVAGADGERDFFTSSESVVSGFERTRDFQTPVTVPTRSLDSVLDELGIEELDLLKIDVEGAEAEVLEAFRGLDRVRCIVGEVHLQVLDTTPEAFYARYLPGFDVTTHDLVPHRATFTAFRRVPAEVRS